MPPASITSRGNELFRLLAADGVELAVTGPAEARKQQLRAEGAGALRTLPPRRERVLQLAGAARGAEEHRSEDSRDDSACPRDRSRPLRQPRKRLGEARVGRGRVHGARNPAAEAAGASIRRLWSEDGASA